MTKIPVELQDRALVLISLAYSFGQPGKEAMEQNAFLLFHSYEHDLTRDFVVDLNDFAEDLSDIAQDIEWDDRPEAKQRCYVILDTFPLTSESIRPELP